MIQSPRLIYVEGIPQSGKSTLSQYIALCLWRARIPAQWYHNEVQGCPVHLGSVHGDPEALVSGAMERWHRYVATIIAIYLGSIDNSRTHLVLVKSVISGKADT